MSAALLLLAAVLALTHAPQPAHALEYGFSDESPTVCFIEDVSDVVSNSDGKASHMIVGSYTWHPHERNAAARLTLYFKDPYDRVLKTLLMSTNAMGGSVPFAFRADVDLPGDYFICATLEAGSGVLADNPILVTFDVDQRHAVPFANEEEEAAVAMRAQYGRRRRQQQREEAGGHGLTDGSMREVAREAVGDKVVFVYRDFGGQVKSILQSPEYLAAIGGELAQLEVEAKRKLEIITDALAKEGQMRSTSESTFSRVWTCALIVMLTIAIVVTWQFSLLRKTLKRKKKI